MDNSRSYDKVNSAIERFLQSGWSKEVEEAIINSYGQDIASQVKAVYRQAVDCPVDWSKESMDSALLILADFLKAEFPWLSKEARIRLNYCYIMTWK